MTQDWGGRTQSGRAIAGSAWTRVAQFDRESPMLDEAGPLPPTSRTRRVPPAERGARRPSDRHFRHRPRDRWLSLPAGWSAHRGPVARSRRGSKRAHTVTVRLSLTPGKRPGQEPRCVGLTKRGRDAACVSTASWRWCRGAFDLWLPCCRRPGSDGGGCPAAMVDCGRDFHDRTRTRRRRSLDCRGFRSASVLCHGQDRELPDAVDRLSERTVCAHVPQHLLPQFRDQPNIFPRVGVAVATVIVTSHTCTGWYPCDRTRR